MLNILYKLIYHKQPWKGLGASITSDF